MNELTVVTLNLHGGQRHRRVSTPRLRRHGPPPEKAATNGAFDVAGALRSFDADVLVLQESWWPDEGAAAVDLVAAESGATVHWVPFGRGIVEPWPHIISARPHRACGRIGLAVVSRVPARLVEMIPVGDVPADPEGWPRTGPGYSPDASPPAPRRSQQWSSARPPTATSPWSWPG